MTNLKVSVCPRRSTLFLALFSITYSWDFLSSPSRTIQTFCVVPAFCLSLVRKVSSNAMKKKKEIRVEPQPPFTFTITVIFLGLCKVVNFCTGQTYVSTVIYLCYLNQTSGTLTRVIYKCGYCFPTLKEYDYITLVKVLLILT